MNKLLILLFFICTSCSHLGVTSLTSNIITYEVTGKTNSEIVVSMLLQKDCKYIRVLEQRRMCE
jgi:hypothetical protein